MYFGSKSLLKQVSLNVRWDSEFSPNKVGKLIPNKVGIIKFDNKLFLQLDVQNRALYLCQKFAESIMHLCLLAEKHKKKKKIVYKNMQRAFYVRMMFNNNMSQCSIIFLVKEVVIFF